MTITTPAGVVVEIGDSTIAMWRVQMAPDVDFLAHLGRLPSGKLQLACRIRTYVDNLVFDSKDKKSWYLVEAKDAERSESDMLTRCRGVYESVLEKSLIKQGWELVKGARSTSDFCETLMRMPGMYVHKELFKTEEPH